MPVLQDRIQETTTTGGTGTLTLAGAVTGYRTFNAAFTLGDVTYYTIDNGSGEWEIGVGTVGAGTLSRNAVLESSNANALVNFSAGTKRVFCSAPTKVLLPDQTSNSGKVLTTNGTDPSWTTTLNGITLGNITPGSGAFTTLSASSTVSGSGFSTYLASPPAIGGTTPAAGNFTTLGATGNVTLGDASTDTVTINGTTTVGTNLTFTGTGNRITGDFSNATIANRVAFQTSTANTITTLEVIPNGTGVASQFVLETDQGLVNTSFLGLISSTALAESRITSGNRGTGTLLPLTFYTGGSERVRIDTSGNVGIGTSSPDGRVRIESAGAYNGTVASKTALQISTQNITGGFAASRIQWTYGQLSNGERSWIEAGVYGSDYLAFGYGTTEHLRISSTGVVTIGSAISLAPTTANALVVNSSGNVISTAPATPPSLTTNGTMVFNLTSNTNLRVSVRGSDGVTRTANIPLA